MRIYAYLLDKWSLDGIEKKLHFSNFYLSDFLENWAFTNKKNKMWERSKRIGVTSNNVQSNHLLTILNKIVFDGSFHQSRYSPWCSVERNLTPEETKVP